MSNRKSSETNEERTERLKRLGESLYDPTGKKYLKDLAANVEMITEMYGVEYAKVIYGQKWDEIARLLKNNGAKS